LKEREIREAASRKYRPQLLTAGFVGKLTIYVKVWLEVRRETRSLAPEDGLYLK
jgi:hypothetical protein